MRDEEEKEETRRDDYDDASWALYMRTVRAIRKSNSTSGIQDSGKYLPNPDEIYQRGADLRWMQHEGFSPEFIAQVMTRGRPSIGRVVYARDIKGLSVRIIEALMGDL
jgi:hypothetical protein